MCTMSWKQALERMQLYPKSRARMTRMVEQLPTNRLAMREAMKQVHRWV